jgi:hypothetical protein
LIFGDVLREITNRRNRNGNIMQFFGSSWNKIVDFKWNTNFK